MEFFTDFFYYKIKILCIFYFGRDGMKFELWKKVCICILPLMLVGCCRIFEHKDPQPYRVVTQVRIVYQNEKLVTQRDFYTEENIRHILDYLRYTDPYGIPKENPELSDERIYYITLIYSDGSERVYEQRADQYIRVDGGKWKRLDPQKALYLGGLFSMMPSDAPPASTGPLHVPIKPQI